MTDETETVNLRGYVFVNSRMSDVDRAVQSTHAGVELYHQNRDDSLCVTWANDHKTLILLDGGGHGSMLNAYEQFSQLCKKLQLPHAKFVEDFDTMNCMFTAFGGVVPSSIYDMDILPEMLEPDYRPVWYDEKLAIFLSQFRLLR